MLRYLRLKKQGRLKLHIKLLMSIADLISKLTKTTKPYQGLSAAVQLHIDCTHSSLRGCEKCATDLQKIYWIKIFGFICYYTIVMDNLAQKSISDNNDVIVNQAKRYTLHVIPHWQLMLSLYNPTIIRAWFSSNYPLSLVKFSNISS